MGEVDTDRIENAVLRLHFLEGHKGVPNPGDVVRLEARVDKLAYVPGDRAEGNCVDIF
jgi:hypothetical protein